MADELTIDVKLAYEDSEGTSDLMEKLSQQIDVTTKLISHVKHNVGVTEEAVKLGDVSSLGWIAICNRDGTNFVQIRTATSGTAFCKLLAGECAVFRFGSGVTAPFLIADTAACQVEYLLVSS